jgi:RNA polymerase sigma factor (sigma-70 family)
VNEVLSAAADPLAAPLARYLLHGDEAGMEEVVARTRPRLTAAAARIGSPSDADDAVQAAYLSLVRRRGTLLEGPVLPWLLTATIRCAYRRKAIVRREAALAERLSISPPEVPEVEGGPDVDRVRGAVARLPQRYRDVVVLCDLLGLAPAEAAPLLDLPPATVRVRLHRGRRLVRSRFSPRFVAAWMAIPWFFAGRGRDAALSNAALAAGGLVTGSTVVLIGVAAIAAGVAIGRYVLPAAAPEADKRVETAAAEVRDLKAQVARLEEAVRTAKAATLAEAPKPIEGRPASQTPPAPAGSGGEAMGEPASAGGAPAAASALPFAIAGREEGLKVVDWKTVGTNMSGMVPLITEMAEALAAGKPPSLTAQGRVMKLNADLIEAATAIEDKWKTGNVNGAFTHPAFMSNAIAATLSAAGRPLTEDQARSLGRLGLTYTEEDTRRLGRYDERTLSITKTIEEADLRDRFFADAFGLLTDEQRAVLVNPASRGRLSLDLYSSGLLWATTAGPISFTTKDDLVADYEKTLLQHQKDLAPAKEAVHAAILEWANGLGKDVLEAPADTLSSMRFLTVAQTTAAAKRQAVLTQRLLDTAVLGEEGVKSLRTWTYVLVPVKK